MPAALRIDLLGDFRLVYGDEPVTSVDTPRLQALVAWLALRRDMPQARRRIAFAFWPDSSEKQAFSNLRNLLYVLRRQWPKVDDLLEIETKSLTWKPDVTCRVDVAEFDRLLGNASEATQLGDEASARLALQQAVALYRGDLLPGCYDEWLLPERERLHQACLRALEELTFLLESTREYGAAVEQAERLVRLDPLREASYRALMRLHALNDDRAAALHAYERCARVLRDEMDLEPAPATKVLYKQIAAGDGGGEAHFEVPGALPSSLPLVGRQPEWKELRAAWRRAEEGRARLLMITGEAGIGKTRLTVEMLDWAGRQGIATAEAHCYAAEGHLAYAPVIEWLRAEALQSGIARLDDVWLGEVSRLLPELGFNKPDQEEAPSSDEEIRRQRLFEGLARAVLATGRPLLLLIDDLQWCDRDTLEWLHFLLRYAPEARLLILGTARIEEVAPLHPLRSLLLDLGRTQQVAEVALGPLDAEETAELGAHVAGRSLSERDAESLHRETEGNPLFVVETVRAGSREMVANRDNQPFDRSGQLLSASQRLPATIQAVIQRRLAQLSTLARTVASVAAVIGRSFRMDTLLRSSSEDEETLTAALDELWQYRIVRTHGADAFDFTHDKLREVAYAEISPSRRRLLHRRVAEALEVLHSEDLDVVSATVAVHYERGGAPSKAVDFYRRAAATAQRIGSSREATRLLERARSLLDRIPSGGERDKLELELLMQQGLALRIAAGHGAPEVKRIFEQASELSGRIGDDLQDFAVQRGLWAVYLIRAEYDAAQAFSDELLAIAEHIDDDSLHLEAEVAGGLTRTWRGELEDGHALLTRARTRYHSERHRGHAQRFGQDPGVSASSVLAFVQALRGKISDARRHVDEALECACEIGHRFSEAYARQHAALTEMVLGDAAAARGHARALLALSREWGFTYWIGPGHILHGWALAATGQPLTGLDQIREGIDKHRRTGARFQSTLWLGLLVDAYRRADFVGEGFKQIDASLESARASGENVWTPELHRLRGSFLAEEAAWDDADEAFQQALALAHAQRSRSLELRAAVSRARLWQQRGRTAQAREQLRVLVNTFPSDGDAPVLQSARSLLQRIAEE